jgi:hypothetical protein
LRLSVRELERSRDAKRGAVHIGGGFLDLRLEVFPESPERV